MTSAPEFGASPRTAWKQDVLTVFDSRDGRYPYAGVSADRRGSLYGTTGRGGAHGAGTVYKLTPPTPGKTTWTSQVLYSFGSGSSDGEFPHAGVVADVHGVLYGTTVGGGSSGDGAVFMLKPPVSGAGPWMESILHSFTNANGDGSQPFAKLLIGRDGSLYGTTFSGGNAGDGIVFRLTPPAPGGTGWTESVLHSFAGGTSDGAGPEAGLIADAQGALYGTTAAGGGGGGPECRAVPAGCGTAFKLAAPPGGGIPWTTSILFAFRNYHADGGGPVAGLTADSSGALYGTTYIGGSTDAGTVFKLFPPGPGQSQWSERVLHDFTVSDGTYPIGGVILDSSGAVYGTTSSGGDLHCTPLLRGCGTLFRLTAAGGSWTASVLHYFNYATGGIVPEGDLIEDASGGIFGTTFFGGGSANCEDGCGTVFELQK